MWICGLCIQHWRQKESEISESSGVSTGPLKFTIESASSSSSRSDDPGSDFDVRQEKTDFCSDSELESCNQDSRCWTDSFVVLMSDSFEVISLPVDMMQVLWIFIRHLSDLFKYVRTKFYNSDIYIYAIYNI